MAVEEICSKLYTVYCVTLLCVRKSHFACENRTLRVEITIERVEITLERLEIILERVKITICVLKSHSYVLKSHSACVLKNWACLSKNIFKNRYACVWISHANFSFLHICVSNLFDTCVLVFSTRNLLLCIFTLNQKLKIILVKFVPSLRIC
jgi:hypothetical protein